MANLEITKSDQMKGKTNLKRKVKFSFMSESTTEFKSHIGKKARKKGTLDLDKEIQKSEMEQIRKRIFTIIESLKTTFVT